MVLVVSGLMMMMMILLCSILSVVEMDPLAEYHEGLEVVEALVNFPLAVMAYEYPGTDHLDLVH